MAETTALKLANHILHVAPRHGIADVTNLKLQKLLYYCQAWHLAIVDSELFADRIEAWVHGPVVPSVFRSFRDYRWKTLPVPAVRPDIETGSRGLRIADHVGDVLKAYGDLSGLELERITHAEDPWRDARNGIPADMPSNAVILPEKMREFYASKLE